jgi:2-keto-3-deoxy-L-rhamnonate aldolase RhmA
VVIAIMVEKKSCVDHLDEILKVPGIDMVQFGASDFSMSIGKPAQYGDPEVVEAELHVIKTALEKGKNPRVELRDPAQAEKYLKMGVKHYCIGWDVRILADWWDTKGAEMRGMVEGQDTSKGATPVKLAAQSGTRAGNY